MEILDDCDRDLNHKKNENGSHIPITITVKLSGWINRVEVFVNCRFCKNYDPRGRNGGYCNLLSVPVQSKWDACRCFLPKFSPMPLIKSKKLVASF